MHLKDFSLVSPDIQSSDVLKAIEIAIPAFAIEQAIANTKTEEERRLSLPAQLVVNLVITQVAGYRLMCACYHSIYAMPAAGYAYACNKVALARSANVPMPLLPAFKYLNDLAVI